VDRDFLLALLETSATRESEGESLLRKQNIPPKEL